MRRSLLRLLPVILVLVSHSATAQDVPINLDGALHIAGGGELAGAAELLFDVRHTLAAIIH